MNVVTVRRSKEGQKKTCSWKQTPNTRPCQSWGIETLKTKTLNRPAASRNKHAAANSEVTFQMTTQQHQGLIVGISVNNFEEDDGDANRHVMLTDLKC